ncbi:MAG TPA: hypothetical protein VM681_07060, partial [Candidatus Thermoplasmatota archaeon]|nr:hypothetical protein [Candidatus Thermoplasmatota archaeon]
MIDVGSPHALEPLRQSWLRRRKRLAVLAGLLIVGAWFGLLTTTVQQETGVSIFGQDGSRVNLQTPGGQRQAAENVPVTVAVSPGRVVRSPEPLEESSIPRPERPPPQFLPPELFRINWLFVLLN